MSEPGFIQACPIRDLSDPLSNQLSPRLTPITRRSSARMSEKVSHLTVDGRCQTMRQLCYSAQTFEIDPCTLSEIWQMRSSMTPCAAGDDANHPSLCVNFLFAFGDEADKQLRTAITFGFRIWWRCLARSFLITWKWRDDALGWVLSLVKKC